MVFQEVSAVDGHPCVGSPMHRCAQYKAKHDLIERATAAAGPSRSTRRAHTQRVLDLTLSPTKNGLDASTKPDTCRVPPANSESHAGLSSKAKGKQKAVEPPMGDASVSASAPNGPFKARTRARALGASQSEQDPFIPTSRAQKRANAVVSSPPPSPVPKKRRKSAAADEGARSVLQPRRSGRLEGPSKPPESLVTPKPPILSDQPPSVSHTSSIKRIRLIVRKPPPSYTNPRQRPPPPKFGANLTDFLSSYVTLDEHEQTKESLQALAHKEAALRDKIELLNKQGRFAPFLYGGSVKGKTPAPVAIAADPNVRDPRRSKDAWEHIVETIIQRGRHGGGLVRGRQVAAQVASRVQVYWDQSAVREDRARAQEEKRVRALAKATVKLVVAEWKKAVFVRLLSYSLSGTTH